MDEELKAYVNAYMDGLEVEYQQQGNDGQWFAIDGFEAFDYGTKFRIKPKVEDKWQRVIDEGYLCKFWDDGVNVKAFKIGRLTHVSEKDTYKLGNEYFYANCEVLREKGIKQPYFQSDDVPEINGCIIAYRKSGCHSYRVGIYIDNIDWSDVAAYIEV